MWLLQVIMRDHTSSVHVEELLRQSQMELQWIQRQLAMIAARNIRHHHLHTKGKVLWYHTLWACYYYCYYSYDKTFFLEEFIFPLFHDEIILLLT